MRIAVYCSASDNLPQTWKDNARALGEWIGRSGSELVYGGVNAGLMHIVADAARAAGAKTVGVVPSRRLDKADKYLSVEIRTSDLAERKRIMLNLADAFIALPGGYGTLDEVASTFAHLSFTGRRAPIILLNTDGIFTHLIDQYRTFVDLGIMRSEVLGNLIVTRNVDEVIQHLEKQNQ